MPGTWARWKFWTDCGRSRRWRLSRQHRQARPAETTIVEAGRRASLSFTTSTCSTQSGSGCRIVVSGHSHSPGAAERGRSPLHQPRERRVPAASDCRHGSAAGSLPPALESRVYSNLPPGPPTQIFLSFFHALWACPANFLRAGNQLLSPEGKKPRPAPAGIRKKKKILTADSPGGTANRAPKVIPHGIPHIV